MVVLVSIARVAATNLEDEDEGGVAAIIGAVIDNSSRIGKEKTVAIKMALEDFYHSQNNTNQSFVLHLMNSHGDPPQAALAARDLIDKQKVQAIIGPQTWEETSVVANVCSENSIPVLSLADATPNWATDKWHFLVQASQSQFLQMKAVSAIVQSWEWYQVNIIYEDTESLSTGILAHLSQALAEAGVGISNLLAIPPFASSSLSHDLMKLKEGQCRVFVVHLSFPLALHLFETAKKLNMMEKDYVWITTDPFTGLVHSLNASTLSSMKGIVGVKSYFSQLGHQYEDFYVKFRRRYSSENPNEFDNEPGIFAAQAYDAAWTLALAMNKTNKKGGQVLLDKILLSNFSGLSGKIQFTNYRLDPAKTFKIINVMGQTYGELGFWSDGQGFSRTIGPDATYSSSMKVLGPVFWPGGPWDSPRGWTLPTIDKPLRIGVPLESTLKQFVNIIQDECDNTTSFQGFAVQLFKETAELLPYHLPYKFYTFNGTYDDLVKQIYYKNFDAVVGDVTIVSYRYEYAEFTQPYTDPGVVMIVPVRVKGGQRGWLFLKPFTRTMWVLIGLMIIYNGFVLWMLERNHFPDLKGSMLNQTGTMCWLSFITFLSLHGDRLHSNLSRMTMVVWLFAGLIITQTYTANLASMLTVEKLEPTTDDVDQLRKGNAIVGCDRGSFLKNYLYEVLHFQPTNIRQISSEEEYAEALRNKEIAAAFLEVPVAKIFLAKYCKEFIQAGPMYKIGGFAFAFPRESPLTATVNKALIKAFENGKVLDLENKMLVSEQCENTNTDEDDTASLGPNSFWALFTLTGTTSTIALLVYVFRKNHSNLL
ncbi:glutamate receptor 2.8-like [Prosopis cineraria]|uniref:glutamate receptor 2.8-like n=1 Tax=Prosopis cineraria TaxID=364024 RepID=UPI00240FC0DD|nr:glutamate receptor 2.8-like [Prosopis cineraria]